MAENPATWGPAERVISDALDAAEAGERLGMVGWSVPKQIAEALRKADLLASEQLTARAQAADAYAEQNRGVHRENMRLRDELSKLQEGGGPAVIALLATVVPLSLYLAGYSWTARMLFCRWRPSRVPLCGGTHRTVDGYIRNHHVNNCYRRLKADHMPVRIDSDSHAAGWAAFAALAWPAVLIGLALMASPPELPAEKERRLRDLEKRNAELEQEAGLGSADHH